MLLPHQAYLIISQSNGVKHIELSGTNLISKVMPSYAQINSCGFHVGVIVTAWFSVSD